MTHRVKPPEAFTRKQKSKPSTKRKCTHCIESFTPPPDMQGQMSSDSETASKLRKRRIVTEEDDLQSEIEIREKSNSPTGAESCSEAQGTDAVMVEGEPEEAEGPEDDAAQALGPRRLRKAETALQWRTSQILLVLERAYDAHNHLAVLRTAESLGIQHVWIVDPVEMLRGRGAGTLKDRGLGGIEDTGRIGVDSSSALVRRIARQNGDWLSIRHFSSPNECINALRADGRQIWVAELGQDAEPLGATATRPLPDRMALVIGREADGVSADVLKAADRRIYLPLRGLSESLNVSVAAAMLLQQLFWLYPSAIGAMADEERCALRKDWYLKLAKTPSQRQEYLKWVDNPPMPFSDLRRPEEHRIDWVNPRVKKRIQAKEDQLVREA
ncbi:hypothetical protein CYMTET_26774 [Cymbomonas tetramitiformis]|uniref:tRNA/rRNA methyltransferase SpoU type domain-containing protein n=1 Tax=Cymbomonas tetramitiformis TaxID=36881 RepID=A0AAE0FRM9_9CHLO|nr:hypothetical protein CYMTET_26774 [Cymbomonas tetramitiformis]